MDFTAALPALRDLGAEVLGISRDSPASHKKFAEKHDLGVKLASDQDHKVTEAYGAWALKKMYGKESSFTSSDSTLVSFGMCRQEPGSHTLILRGIIICHA